jgi:hypothetical protein
MRQARPPAKLERCAQVIGFDPAGNDGARLRVVNVGASTGVTLRPSRA